MRTPNEMTVAKLKALLERFPDDMPVFVGHPSHDYWHTPLASEMTDPGECSIIWSEYHGTFKMARENTEFHPEDQEETEKSVTVLVLE